MKTVKKLFLDTPEIYPVGHFLNENGIFVIKGECFTTIKICEQKSEGEKCYQVTDEKDQEFGQFCFDFND